VDWCVCWVYAPGILYEVQDAPSINFVTCHDGFTLHDLVSYNDKHNEANLDNNCDGDNRNRSWSCGAEGPTSNPKVKALRERQKRNFLALLLLSQGVPMITGGDELGRTQRGNNNAYCQDNELSWMNWDLDVDAKELIDFVGRLVKVRKSHPIFCRRHFFQGRAIKGVGIKDITWLTPDGREMTDQEWNQSFARSLGVYLAGAALGEDDQQGRPLQDDDFILLINSHDEAIPFLLPAGPDSGQWRVLLDTSCQGATERAFRDGDTFPLAARSLALLVRQPIVATLASRAPYEIVITATDHQSPNVTSGQGEKESGGWREPMRPASVLFRRDVNGNHAR
jgi:isoamylase